MPGFRFGSRVADDGARTRDLRLGKPTLYQLSYVRDDGILPPVALRSVTGEEARRTLEHVEDEPDREVASDAPERPGETAVDRVGCLGVVDGADEPVADRTLGVAL